jgi:hypothetical protein
MRNLNSIKQILMKKIIIVIAISVMAFQLSAQVNFANSAEIKSFLKSKTLVVLDDDPFSSFNETIKACMPKFWTITSYEYITVEEFETKMSNSSYSFLMLSEAQQMEDGVKCTYNFLNLILGGSTNLNNMPDLGSVPLSYIDVDEENYLYKIGGILVFMQSHVKYASEHPSVVPKLVNKDSGIDIKTKELWLLKDELPSNFNTIEKIKAVYPYTVKLVTKEEIKKAIEDKNANVVYLHKVGPQGTITSGKCWKFLVTAKEGEVLYYDGHTINTSNPDALLEKDFKAIAK